MLLDLSGAGFDPSACIDLAKQVITGSLPHEHCHHINFVIVLQK
jgi:hypothetical protein